MSIYTEYILGFWKLTIIEELRIIEDLKDDIESNGDVNTMKTRRMII